MATTRTRGIPPGEVTRLLEAWRKGDATARDELVPVIYRELRRRASARLRHERASHTLNPTDLVHQTYLRLCAQNPAWQNREQFFAVAGRLMRRILIDRAREKRSEKRGGSRKRLDIDAIDVAIQATPDQLLAIDEALAKLTCEDAAAARLGVPVATASVVGDSVWDMLAATRARSLAIGLLSGGYGMEELERGGAYRVYEDPADLLKHLDEVGGRR